MRIKHITWTGDLAVDHRLDGWIRDTHVAAITVNEGKIALAYVNGLQTQAVEGIKSVKRAKELAEELLAIFVNSLNARFYQEDELVVVDALRANDYDKGGDEQLLLLLHAIWEQREMDTREKAEWIRDNLEDLHEVIKHERQHAHAGQ